MLSLKEKLTYNGKPEREADLRRYTCEFRFLPNLVISENTESNPKTISKPISPKKNPMPKKSTQTISAENRLSEKTYLPISPKKLEFRKHYL